MSGAARKTTSSQSVIVTTEKVVFYEYKSENFLHYRLSTYRTITTTIPLMSRTASKYPYHSDSPESLLEHPNTLNTFATGSANTFTIKSQVIKYTLDVFLKSSLTSTVTILAFCHISHAKTKGMMNSHLQWLVINYSSYTAAQRDGRTSSLLMKHGFGMYCFILHLFVDDNNLEKNIHLVTDREFACSDALRLHSTYVYVVI